MPGRSATTLIFTEGPILVKAASQEGTMGQICDVRFDYGGEVAKRRRCAVPWCRRPGRPARLGERFKEAVPLCERHSLCTRCGAPIFGMRRTGTGLVTDCCGHWEARLIREAWRIPWTQWLRSRWAERRALIVQARVVVDDETIATGLPWPEEF